MLFPRAHLHIRHRSGSKISLPLIRQVSIGANSNNDVILTGNQLPCRLCCVVFKKNYYHLVADNGSRCHLPFKTTYLISGFQLYITPVSARARLLLGMLCLAAIMAIGYHRDLFLLPADSLTLSRLDSEASFTRNIESLRYRIKMLRGLGRDDLALDLLNEQMEQLHRQNHSKHPLTNQRLATLYKELAIIARELQP